MTSSEPTETDAPASSTSSPSAAEPRGVAARLRAWGRTWRDDPFLRRLAVVAAVGFALRLVWVLVATRTPQGLHDPTFYVGFADSVASGDGYSRAMGEPTAYYPAGYPLLLGALVWVLRLLPGEVSVEVVASGLNLVAGTATVVLLGLLGRRLVGARAALAAAGVLAVVPNLVVHTATVLTETVFDLFLVAVLAVWMWRPWEGRDPTLLRLGATGLLVGAAVLIRPVVVPAVGLAALVWLVAVPGWRRRIVGVGVLAAATLVVVAPWVARNAVVMERPALSLNTGDNLCIGNNPAARGHFALPDECFADQPSDLAPDELERWRDDVLADRAVDWARANPGAQPALVLWRTFYTFEHGHDGTAAVESYGDDPWLGERGAVALAWVSDAGYFGVLVLAALAVPRFLTRHDLRRPAWLAAMAGIVVSVWPFFGDARFNVPFVVLACLLAGVTLSAVPWRGAHDRADAPEPEPASAAEDHD